jgi:hypothetical protein
MKIEDHNKKIEFQNNFNRMDSFDSIETIIFKNASLQPNPLLNKKDKKY